MTRLTALLTTFSGTFRFSLAKILPCSLLLLGACSDDAVGSISGTLVFPGNVASSPFQGEEEGQLARPSSAPAFVPGEVIVAFKEDAQLRSLSVQGLTLQRTQTLGLPRTALYRAEGLDEEETAALIGALNARPDIAYAEPNRIKTIAKVPNDEFYSYQWHYEAMNLPAAWNISDGTQREVTVAVVDSGSTAHPDLQSVWLGGYDFVSNPADSADGDGYDADPTDLGQASAYHGSHVAGTVAARTNNGRGVAGVSWGAKVLPVRVIGVTGAGTLLDTVNGILWAAGERVAGVPENPNPAQVINLSLGGEAPCSRSEQSALDRVRAKGVTVVVAAGNSDIDANAFAPANCGGVITVGATGPQGTRAPYSNYGAAIDVMAPGGDTSQTFVRGGQSWPVGVLSTVRDDSAGAYSYEFYQGTSMAAPHVAGLVALMLAQEPGLTPERILARLEESAEPLSASGCKRASGAECGAGRVNAAAALGGGDDMPPLPETNRAKTYVTALHCVASCTDFDPDRSRTAAFVTEQLKSPFQLGDLRPGTYIVAAWQDLDEDGRIDGNEPFGRSETNLTLSAGRALSGVDIYLEASSPSRASTGVSVSKIVEEVVRQK